MSRVEAFRKTNLRCALKEFRTDISMAVDDPFPFVYGLVDKSIITEHQFKECLEKQAGDGIHKAVHSLVSWVLEQSRATVENFCKYLNTDYNLDSYPRLRNLLTDLKSMRWFNKRHLWSVSEWRRPDSLPPMSKVLPYKLPFLQVPPAAQPAQSHNQTSAESDAILHTTELESVMAEVPFDGILQWALHSISRPYSNSQDCFQ
uniref:HSR domain-containing protein n=1 Tax=Knipowitschia caucasica TaxID=637954 RepID=A0AAV2JSE6_KNICA